MRYIWDEAKRKANLKKHGLDFADVEKVFIGPLVLFEDRRESYGERRHEGQVLQSHILKSLKG